MSALATVAGKSFNGKFTAKIDFSDRVSYITIANADIGNLKSLHTLLGKYLDHIQVKFEQNSYELYKILGFLYKIWLTILTKYWRHFGRRLCD